MRSASLWSAGIEDKENSIYNAMIHAIRKSEHYIYIENQFFITTCGEDKDVRNGIGEALLERIVKAHKYINYSNNSSIRIIPYVCVCSCAWHIRRKRKKEAYDDNACIKDGEINFPHKRKIINTIMTILRDHFCHYTYYKCSNYFQGWSHIKGVRINAASSCFRGTNWKFDWKCNESHFAL